MAADLKHECLFILPNVQSLLVPHILGSAGVGRGVDTDNNAGAANVNGKGKKLDGGYSKATNNDKGNDTNSKSSSYLLSLSHTTSHSNSNSHAESRGVDTIGTRC